jgi:hypothetical protein
MAESLVLLVAGLGAQIVVCLVQVALDVWRARATGGECDNRVQCRCPHTAQESTADE